MINNKLQSKDLGMAELGGKASSPLLVEELLRPEELAILSQIVTANTQRIIDEVPQFSQDILDQFQQMHR